MRYVTLAAASVFLIMLLGGAAFAKQQDRSWQTGHLIDLKQTSCGFFSKCLDLSIETDNYYYLCQWSRERRGHWYRVPDLRSAATVEFSIKTHEVYLKTPDGKQFRMQLLEKQLKPFRLTAPPQPTA